jgi:hypothetical protein
MPLSLRRGCEGREPVRMLALVVYAVGICDEAFVDTAPGMTDRQQNAKVVRQTNTI